MAFDLAKTIRDLGEWYKYFKYVPPDLFEYAANEPEKFIKLVRNIKHTVTGQLSTLSPNQLDEVIGSRIHHAYLRSERAQNWLKAQK